MKKRINICKYIMTAIMLLSFNHGSFAQKSLVSKQWQQRMEKLVPELKKEWIEGLSRMDRSVTRSIGQPQEDLSDLTYTPEAIFVLDYSSYKGLTSESNLEFLMKLDTTRIDYLVFNKRENKYVGCTFGIFKDGRWRSGGYGDIFPHIAEIDAALKAKNISVSGLRVAYTPEHRPGTGLGYNIFYENGQLMCFRPDMDQPRPLLETLIKYREHDEKLKRDNERIKQQDPDGEKFRRALESVINKR